MKIVAARLNHETNTFSPVPTPLSAFGIGTAPMPGFGSDALMQARGTRTALGAFIQVAEARGDNLQVALNAAAYPSGRVHDAAFERMADAIVDSARGGCDLILLDLHGAMVTESFDDAEGELLQRLRREAPQTPIALALDLHGNVTRRMVELADAIVGFKTYPHVDMFETGAHAARLGLLMATEGRRLAVGLAQPPLLSHTLRSATASGSMQRAVQAAIELEQASTATGGIHAATVFAGFSLADIEEAGVSVVVVADAPAAAQSAADRLALRIWHDRDGFVHHSEPLADSVARAARLKRDAPAGSGPVLLLDHGDNVMSGGPCDTATVLEECLRQGLRTIGSGPIADPRTVDACIAAGVGASLTVALGNKTPLGLAQADRPPLALAVTVRAVGDGHFRIDGPIYTGETWSMGRCVALDFAGGTVVVSERPMEPVDPAVFRCLQVEPSAFDHLILKSRMYCRPTFEPLSCGLVECDSRGVTGSDYGLFRFERLRRPIHPLDPGDAALVYPQPPS